ncbi:MAG: hypothetical protein BGO98_09020 [Myxococcales bacterium 68-20]|nr:MAG: hypothetical protein BGO98_09020 [Myxococcales bacterium 68-20]
MKRSRFIRCAFAASVLAVMTTGLEARADEVVEPRLDPRARAQELFDSALADAEAGNFVAACPKFLASQEADPKTSTLLNLANCYERNGQTASAWGAFREAEVLARKAARPDWETAARTRAETLEPKLLRLSVVVEESSRVAGLVVTRDGARLTPGEWGFPIPVDPGEHVIAASAEGHAPWETRVTVEEPKVEVAVPRLEPLPAPPASIPAPVLAMPAHTPASSGWSTMKTTGVILAGVGGAALLAGGLMGVIAQGNYEDARARCSDAPRGCPADAVTDADSAYGLATGATIAVIAGAVLFVGGATFYALSPDGRRATPPQGASPRLGVGPRGLAASW